MIPQRKDTYTYDPANKLTKWSFATIKKSFTELKNISTNSGRREFKTKMNADRPKRTQHTLDNTVIFNLPMNQKLEIQAKKSRDFLPFLGILVKKSGKLSFFSLPPNQSQEFYTIETVNQESRKKTLFTNSKQKGRKKKT